MSIYVNPAEWRLSTGGIKYKLMNPSPSGAVDEETGTIEEKYIIQSKDLVAFLNLSFPLGIALDVDNIVLTPNRRYPGSNAYVTSRVSYQSLEESLPCDPYGIDPDAPDGTYCKFLVVTINYVTGKQQEDEGDSTTLLEVSADAAGEFLMHSARGKATWKEVGGDSVQGIQVPISKFVPETQWSVRWPNINRSYIPGLMDSMRNSLGKINSAEMSILMGAAEKTVLFVGYSYSEQLTWRDGFENTPATIDMKFLEKNIKQGGDTIGHNYFFREEEGEFQELFLPNGENVYAEEDLNGMLP